MLDTHPYYDRNPWGQFRFAVNCSAQTMTIQSLANDKYVSAELGYTDPLIVGMLRARASTVESWENFKLPSVSSSGYKLQSAANNLYFDLDLGNPNHPSMLRADTEDVVGELFRMALGFNSYRPC